jgi:hypothetical protein
LEDTLDCNHNLKKKKKKTTPPTAQSKASKKGFCVRQPESNNAEATKKRQDLCLLRFLSNIFNLFVKVAREKTRASPSTLN